MQCAHIKANGEACEALAIRNQPHCYFHHRALNIENQVGHHQYRFPLLDDPLSVQLAILEITRGIAHNQLSDKTAKMLLSAMRIASANAARCKPKSRKSGKPVKPALEVADEMYR